VYRFGSSAKRAAATTLGGYRLEDSWTASLGRTYPLLMAEEVKHNRRRGRTRISGKHQVTLPVDALAGAGLKVGDRLRADVSGPGQITLVREEDPLEEFAGALTGVYPEGYLDDLRREWT
jgi:bifunctional DNA-binding transcriptional regulator/antitoxin component of YhaV-PrlF toxin-antitoxin module